MKRRKRALRTSTGTFTVELPFVLWVFFFLLFLPMLNLATTFVRITFLYGATHNACISAARARSFQNPINGDPTAVSLAQDGANAYAAAFTGIHILTLDTAIVTTDIATHKQTIQSTPLTNPADVNTNTYQVQVTVNGASDPLFPIPSFLPVSGLNQPLLLTISDRQYFENPQGLVF